jgi:methylase of polypeptide subunit release factors
VCSEVREGPLDAALRDGEVFPMVVADPPWLPGESLAEYPDDPPGAVDGGIDGTDVALECLTVGCAHLAPEGHLLLQVGLSVQVERVAQWLAAAAARDDRDAARRAVLDVRDRRPGGFLVHIGPSGIGSSRRAG